MTEAFGPKQRLLNFHTYPDGTDVDLEVQTIGWCFDLFADLQDDDARQRVAEYLFRKYVQDRRQANPTPAAVTAGTIELALSDLDLLLRAVRENDPKDEIDLRIRDIRDVLTGAG